MEFEIPETLANELLGTINEDSLLAKRLSEYGLSRGKRVVPSHLFDAASLNTLYSLCRTANERGLMFQMLALDNIHAAPAARKIPSLEHLIPGLIAWLSRDMIDGWLYKLSKDGVLLPWLHKAHGMDQPGQQHTILAELIEPAIYHVTRQPSDQTGDQMFQAGDFSGSWRSVDIIQCQHLEH